MSNYVEPDVGPDLLDGMELIFQQFGKSLRRQVAVLPPRVDVVAFNPLLHRDELERNLKWRDCPDSLRPQVLSVLRDYWDVFCEAGLRNNIRGFSFRVDTGDCKPICCKSPRYGPHEIKVMTKLVDQLEANGLVEDSESAWGAQIVLAAKANQETVPWPDYQWRLCVSYRRLNQVTRPFTFPIPRCDDAVADIGPDARYMLSMDMDAGYWQVGVDEQASREKLAFFTPGGKKHWTVMPMGALNAHAVFVAMMTKLQTAWTANAVLAKIPCSGSKVIVDDILLYARTVSALFNLWRLVLTVLQHHSATIKLKKCKFFDTQCEFVGVDIGRDGNSPAASKFAAFKRIPRPETWADLRMIIGMFGFYSAWIQNFEVRIKPWRSLQKRAPNPGSVPVDVERQMLAALWTPAHSNLLEALKSEILSGPVLARPDAERRFYVKTDWSKDGIGAVLLQASTDTEAIEAEASEAAGGHCLFDRTKKGLRLRPVAFLSRSTTDREHSYHSYIGEACAGRWTFGKWRKYLVGREFTWLSDCSGLKRFHEECEGIPTHQAQRWRAELSLFHKTLEHRPAEMMTDCDVLSRYNATTAGWREADLAEELREAATPVDDTTLTEYATPRVQTTIVATTRPTTHTLFSVHSLSPTCPAAFTFLPKPQIRGAASWKADSPFVRAHDNRRNIFTVGSVAVPIQEACTTAGIQSICTPTEDQFFPLHLDLQGAEEYHSLQEQSEAQLDLSADYAPHDWLIATYTGPRLPDGPSDPDLDAWLSRMDSTARVKIARHHLQAAVFLVPIRFPDALARLRRGSTPPPFWSYRDVELRNTRHGGRIETDHRALCLLPDNVASQFYLPLDTEPPADMECYFDDPTAGNDDALWLDGLQVTHHHNVDKFANEHPHSAIIARYIKYNADPKPVLGYPVYDPSGPGPSIADPLSQRNGNFFDGAFGIWLHTPTRMEGPACRAIRPQELMLLFGLSEERTWSLMRARGAVILERMRPLPGKHGIAALLLAIRNAEDHATITATIPAHDDRFLAATVYFSVMHETNTSDPPSYPPELLTAAEAYTFVMDEVTTIPLPSDGEWKVATEEDPDLHQVTLALQRREPVPLASVADKTYARVVAANLLELDDGIVYYYEHSKASRVRQLRSKVVPPKFRRVALAACHVSPFAGHSGITKTMYRLRARFWWPGMTRDAHEGVLGCAHCNLANNSSHEAKMLLHTLSCDGPFDTVFLDLWSPGQIPSSDGATKVLTCLDGLTGFANACFLYGTIDAKNVAMMAFTHFFVPFGLPRMIFVDRGGEFAGIFRELFRFLQVPIETVAPENHKVIRCERFHRYLKKVQKIHAADLQDLTQWKQGTLFACYGWNASPIDGTDIPRCVAAIGRDFPFPIDLSPALSREGVHEGQQALDYLDAASPLLYRQRELLDVLNSERRLRHTELRNAGITARTFDIGDLVIVRKQLKSDAALGISAKLVFSTKGPYRVLGPATPGTYKLQKLPFLRGMRRKGRIVKEMAARMERIPSTLVLHKKPDGADTRFSTLYGNMVNSPLEKWLGVLKFGAYCKAPNDASWAFDRLDSMWSDAVDDDEDDSSDDSADDADESAPDDDDDPLPPDTDTTMGTPDDELSGTDAAHSEPSTVTRIRPAHPDPPLLPTAHNPPPIPLTNVPPRSLRALWRRIDLSSDRLFFVKWIPPGVFTAKWRLAQVDLLLSDPRAPLQYGQYTVKWWTPHIDDRKTRPYTECRFMPEVRALRPDGGGFGPLHSVRPDKVAALLLDDTTLHWIQDTIMLAEDMITGPFDFIKHRSPMQGPRNKAVSELNRIDPMFWDRLEQQGPTFDIDTTTIRALPADRPVDQYACGTHIHTSMRFDPVRYVGPVPR